MILIDNLNFLTERFPLLWQAIKPLEDQNFSTVKVMTAKNGSPTLMVEKDGKSLYLHSSYNPQAEAERFITRFTEVEKYHHVFFFGWVLGYHIEAFMQKYPKLKSSLPRPVPESFLDLFVHCLLSQLP